MENLISLLVIEDEPITRSILCQFIKQDSRLRLAGEAGNYAQAKQLLTLSYDVMLVDLNLKDTEGDGIDLIKQTKILNKSKIMVISVFGDEQSVITAIEAGADGYLLKDIEPTMLGNAIQQIMDGGAPISPAIASHILRRFRQKDPPDSSEQQVDTEKILTPREVEVLDSLAKGFSYKEVASLYNLSYHTVASYVKQIYEKLAVHSRSEAVYEAIQRRIIKIDI